MYKNVSSTRETIFIPSLYALFGQFACQQEDVWTTISIGFKPNHQGCSVKFHGMQQMMMLFDYRIWHPSGFFYISLHLFQLFGERESFCFIIAVLLMRPLHFKSSQGSKGFPMVNTSVFTHYTQARYIPSLSSGSR